VGNMRTRLSEAPWMWERFGRNRESGVHFWAL